MSAKRSKSSQHKICCFCGLSQNNELEFGRFYEHGEIVTHYYCLLLSSNMQQRGKDDQGILGFLKTDIQKEIRRGKKLVCSYCKKTGATLGCCNVKCKKIFHYPCGLRAGTLNQFFGEFRSYCISHRPKQKIDTEVKDELAKSSEVVCYICYEQVDPHDKVSTMWAPCCKKNAWFHRKCVQELAMSAGYFFKCPLCNDKKLFQKAMLEFGIFIPSQDASWELVPNAFQELLYRHDQCDAPICLCPKGRKYTSFNAKWKLALCQTCGSQGIHMACGELKWANSIWECVECISILGKSKEIASSSTIRDSLQNVSNSEDSDSDISVGKDSPIPFTSSLPLISSTSQMLMSNERPGPRTFKLKQLQETREMQNNNKHRTSESVDMTLNSANMEQHNLSASSKEIFMNVSSSVTDPILYNDANNFNSSIRHFKSRLDKQANNTIILDSDDDTIEATNCTPLNDTFIITEDNKDKKDYLSQRKNSIVHDSSPSEIGKLLQENYLSQNDSNHCLMNNLNVTEFDNLKKYSLQNEIKSNVLDDIIKLNHKTGNTCNDFVSNIKITNVVSLASEEFENVLSVGEKQKINRQTLQSNNELINSNAIPQPLFYEHDISESNLKRKRDKTTLVPVVSFINESKKMKKNNSVLEETSSNKSNLQISNNNENNISVNESNLQNKELHIPFKQNCNVDEYIQYIPNTKCSLQMNASNNVVNNKTETFAILTNEEQACSDMNLTNGTNKIFENLKIDNKIKNCDGDAGTSLIVESRNRSATSETKSNYVEKSTKSNHSKSKKLQISEQWKCQSDVEMAMSKCRTSNNKFNNICWQEKSKTTDCNYSQLIPEYVCLRDLKFRVHNINNLQMILYDKFAVNINMECVSSIEKNATFNTSMKKTVQQNIFKSQNETFTNFRSGNILQNISSDCKKDKSTCIFVNEQSKNYHDDTKENLDPVTTIPCKNISDNLLMNTTLITNNINVSINNNNQNENGNLTVSVSKTIENNDGGRSHESISLVDNIETSFDATTSHNDYYNKSVSNIKQNIENLNFDNVTNSTCEIHCIEKDLENDSYNSTELVRRVLFLENRINNKPENINETDFKVSIDLKKIKSFVDNNPDLFSKCNKKSNEWCIEQKNFLKKRKNIQERFKLSEHIKNSDIDKSKHIENIIYT